MRGARRQGGRRCFQDDSQIESHTHRCADPNRTWVADITYVPTQEGWLYLAAVEDLYSRKIVGWSMSERIDSRLVVDALEMAVARQLPGDGLVAHRIRACSMRASITESC